ncbi:MAG: hypothetical protein L3J58_08495, partial [Emcibacter sp.]|nr:hypothetical protein [Emcibacter sp.]
KYLVSHKKIFLKIFLILKPMAMDMALILSPIRPFNQLRAPTLRSFLQWPMIGSIALRRFMRFFIAGVMPRFLRARIIAIS